MQIEFHCGMEGNHGKRVEGKTGRIELHVLKTKKTFLPKCAFDVSRIKNKTDDRETKKLELNYFCTKDN